MSGAPPVPELDLTPQLAAPVAGRVTASPYNFELTASESLRLTVHNSQTGIVIATHVRVLQPRLGIVTNVYHYAPASDRSSDWEDWVIGEGYLLNVTVYASSGSPSRGQTFVRLQIIRGRGAATTVLGTLVQGYVTGNQDLAWPGSPLAGSLEGDGYSRTFTGTDPAAGGGAVEAVPTGARWRLHVAYARFVTNATVGNRIAYLQLLTPASASIGWSQQAVPATASGTFDYYWQLGMPLEGAPAGNKGVAGAPDLVMTAGYQINIGALNLTAGDNFGAPSFVVDEWLEAN